MCLLDGINGPAFVRVIADAATYVAFKFCQQTFYLAGTSMIRPESPPFKRLHYLLDGIEAAS